MFRSWWKNTSKMLKIVQIIGLIVVIGLIVSFIGGYFFDWGWAGLGPYTSPPHTSSSEFQRGKTLWDWMQLLFIPIVLAVAGFWFNHRERKAAELRADAERKIAQDNQRELALQEFFKNMSELLLHENLRKSDEDAEVRTIARVRTLTVLSGLDGRRKGSLVQFLNESGLINQREKYIEKDCVIDLDGADLSKAKLSDTIFEKMIFRHSNLSEADLRECLLTDANLGQADLHNADLRKAAMEEACLVRANLRGADLREAGLIGADLQNADLREVNLSNAYLGKIEVIGGGVARIETTNSANLSEANLRKAILVKADLTEAYLMNAILIEANLQESRLFGANLQGADLRKANLSGATGTTPEQLAEAKSLQGAIMPNGSKHP